jgi:hypothetical protein
MKNSVKKIISYVPLLGLLLPGLVLASAGTDSVSAGLHLPGFSSMFGGGLAGESSLPLLILDVVQLLLFFAGGIAVLFIIIGGFFYITAQGNEEQAEKGKKALINAIIGIVIVIMAYAIISVVQNTVGT